MNSVDLNRKENKKHVALVRFVRCINIDTRAFQHVEYAVLTNRKRGNRESFTDISPVTVTKTIFYRRSLVSIDQTSPWEKTLSINYLKLVYV